MWVADEWTDFELLDAGNGEKLERWGPYILRRPDPQAIWPADKNTREWSSADAVYRRSASGGGHWESDGNVPECWEIGYKRLRFKVRPMQFKHTGIFPEQAVNWDWIVDRLGECKKRRAGAPGVLNLFAYTGASSVAAASAGASVCHVDAARGIVAKAKENVALSGIGNGGVRYIVDDVLKFVRRERRRNARYDAVIMDPPAYGRGPGGELWKAETHLYETVEICADLLADRPLFFIINAYAAGISASSIENILRAALCGKFGGRAESSEIGLPLSRRDMVLPCGCSARWERG